MPQVSLPGYREPWFDASGNISRPWWLFLQGISGVIGGGQVPDLSKIVALLEALQSQVDSQAIVLEPSGVSQALREIGELRAIVESRTDPDLTVIRRRLDELECQLLDVRPSIDPSQFVSASALAAYALLSGAPFTGTVSAPKFQTSTGSIAGVASATPVTIFAIPNAAPAARLVSVNVGTVNDAVNYSAFALVLSDGSSARIALSSNATNQTITLSGLNIQSTQNSGTTLTINSTITRIG